LTAYSATTNYDRAAFYLAAVRGSGEDREPGPAECAQLLALASSIAHVAFEDPEQRIEVDHETMLRLRPHEVTLARSWFVLLRRRHC